MMNTAGRGLTAVLLLLAVLLSATAGTARAQEDPTAGSSDRDLDTESVTAFFDRRTPELLEEKQVPGTVVSVVADGRPLMAQGYGYADLEERKPAAPEESAFLTASLTKTVTATAILQLVDAGDVDLHTDVNDYLPDDTALADTHPGQPVTLHHLLTHSAGLDDPAWGIGTDDPAEVLSLREYVRETPAKRLHPPGRFTAYTNYGYALVGLVVEEVSGQPYEKYVHEHILDPLGMAGSGVLQPSEALERGSARQYHRVDGEDRRARTDYGLNAPPMGGMYATAADFGRFMLAHLNDGELDGQRILSQDSATAMRERQFSAASGMPGSGYGMWELTVAGRTVLAHGGDNNGAHAIFALVPEENVGVFVATNGDGDPPDPAEDVPTLLLEEFFAEFLPSQADPASSSAEAADVPERDYSGTYRTTWASRSGPESLFSLLDHVTVRQSGDGTLAISGAGAGQHWLPVEPGVFAAEDGSDRVTFIEDDGTVTGLGFDSNVTQNYQRVAWHAHPATHLGVVAAGLLLMVSMLGWSATALVRRLRGQRSRRCRAASGARLLAGATGLVCLGFTGMMVSLAGREDVLNVLIGVRSPLLVAPLTVAAALALGVLACAALAWRHAWWGLAGRVHYSLVTVGLVAFLGFAYHHNLIWTP
ncbi:serine hydrolase domain-containing protein [Allosalinactinospora lopnorensis]|uniref:serine hydrolase domain-containing protein n=1 Tax=Allosalinactinospora lopnorensis TaxID=1352348 RepID=UPI000623D3E7|nr:serine hydrolase domain-containing protein [Allosalinactinospora lopnorensis]